MLVHHGDMELTPETAEAGLDVFADGLAQLLSDGEELIPVVLACADSEGARKVLRDQMSDRDSILWQYVDGRASMADIPEVDTVLQ